MPACAQVAEQRGDAGALALRVVGVDELAAVVGERPGGAAASAVGNRRRAALQLQRQLLLAELAHQLGLLLDQDQLALVDDADAVGHLLGLLDVVRGEDDGDAAVAQRAHHLPTCRCAARRRRRRSARRGTGSAARAPAPWRSSRGASCRPTAS